MAHSLSAKKRIRQTAKRRARNRARKESVKLEIKSFTAALAANDLDKAEAELKKADRQLDIIAAKGTIHKNAAARKKSRLAKRLKAARAGVKGTVAAAGATGV